MEETLLDLWLRGAEPIPVRDDASAAVVRLKVRALGARQRLPAAVIEALTIIASELARNQLDHALAGQIAVRALERTGVPGLELIAADRGPGIQDPAGAIRGSVASPKGLGAGLSAVRRLADEMDLDVRWGEGTCVWARKFAAPVPRRSEVGLLGRSREGEPISGDHGQFIRRERHLVLGVADGLGHGAPAREASSRAMAVLGDRAMNDPRDALEACDRALVGTRGAVMAVARIDEERGELEVAATGNVETTLFSPEGMYRFRTSGRIMGGAVPHRIAPSQRMRLAPPQVLVMATDGLASSATLAGERALQRAPPIAIAQHLIEKFGRAYDDALVLVVRVPALPGE